MAPPVPALVTLELSEVGAVIAGGTRTTSWRVRLDRVWRSVAEAPGAEVELQQAGPGTIWERRILVALRPGTELERVVSEPDRRGPQSPLSHLEGARQRPRRRVQRARFRVSARGELLAEASGHGD